MFPCEIWSLSGLDVKVMVCTNLGLVSVEIHSERGLIFILQSLFQLPKHTLSTQIIKNAHTSQEQSYSESSSGAAKHTQFCFLPFELHRNQKEPFSDSAE